MSKAILVIDMPENCLKCKLQDWANCRIIKGCHTGDTRPDWCPLKEFPQKKKDTLMTNYKRYVQGWNDCIDRIEKGSEEDEQINRCRCF